MIDQLLVSLEKKYSEGKVTRNIEQWQPSPLDPKGAPLRIHDGHRMGKKMTGLEHNYAPVYSYYLAKRRVNTLVEMGVLRGIGLAIWCDVFPNAQVIGLDIDPSHFMRHKSKLIELGAFKSNTPLISKFDELSDEAATGLRILAPDGIDVFIDDALHYDAAIIQAFEKFWPLINKGGVYFIEDNSRVVFALRRKFPQVRFNDYKEMTVAVKE